MINIAIEKLLIVYLIITKVFWIKDIEKEIKVINFILLEAY
tara:strand:+ start:6367 stop:6489 length:123 start_codon:yes stop_codon:yes gene_type:complete